MDEYQKIDGDFSDCRIGIVAAEYQKEIMDKMLQEALDESEKLQVEVVQIYRVPGSFDIPLFVKKLLERNDVDGVVALGTVITGETDHDQIVAKIPSDKIASLSLEYNKPVALGITGPRQTREQAIARIPRSREIVRACLKMIKEYNK